MSSFRVRTQDKVLEKIGATKRSSNPYYDTTYTAFRKMEDDLVNLHHTLENYSNTLKSFHNGGVVLSTSIHTMASQQLSECPTELHNFFQNFNETCISIDMNLSNNLLEIYNKTILRVCEGWIRKSEDLKKKTIEFDRLRIIFDHYTRKVVNLRDGRDKRAVSGKVEKPKDIEKLLRNEQKLSHATKEYNEYSEKIIEELKAFNHGRYTVLAPLVCRVIEFRKNYIKSMYEIGYPKLQNIASNTTNNAELDQMANDLHQQKIPAKTIDSKKPTEPTKELGVISDSFDAFTKGSKNVNEQTSSVLRTPEPTIPISSPDMFDFNLPEEASQIQPSSPLPPFNTTPPLPENPSDEIDYFSLNASSNPAANTFVDKSYRTTQSLPLQPSSPAPTGGYVTRQMSQPPMSVSPLPFDQPMSVSTVPQPSFDQFNFNLSSMDLTGNPTMNHYPNRPFQNMPYVPSAPLELSFSDAYSTLQQNGSHPSMEGSTSKTFDDIFNENVMNR